MTSHAVLHDYLSALIDGTYGLSLLARDKLVNVVHTVFALEVVLPKDVVVRYVTVITRGIAGMRSVHPRGIVRGHDVAVDVFSTRKCNTTSSNLGKILRGAYDSRASFADDYLASILSL